MGYQILNVRSSVRSSKNIVKLQMTFGINRQGSYIDFQIHLYVKRKTSSDCHQKVNPCGHLPTDLDHFSLVSSSIVMLTRLDYRQFPLTFPR